MSSAINNHDTDKDWNSWFLIFLLIKLENILSRAEES